MRHGQRRFRVTYATKGRKGQNTPQTWANTDEAFTAYNMAQSLAAVPNVAGTYIYDREERKIFEQFGDPIGDTFTDPPPLRVTARIDNHHHVE